MDEPLLRLVLGQGRVWCSSTYASRSQSLTFVFEPDPRLYFRLRLHDRDDCNIVPSNLEGQYLLLSIQINS